MKLIKLPNGLRVGQNLVTQREWNAVMSRNNSYWRGDNLPVDSVSYHDALAFCQHVGSGCRLLTADEWEYACRGGSDAAYCFGDNKKDLHKYAWFLDNANSCTHCVGGKKPNDFGLYDMHGNLWEWTSTADCDNPNRFIIRGGSWSYEARACNNTAKLWYEGRKRDFNMGFRIAFGAYRPIDLPDLRWDHGNNRWKKY